MTRKRRRRRESEDEIRNRVVNETALYLTTCLDHPELAVSIPVIPAGSGEFPRSLAGNFWRHVLFE
ncbi:MAG: hypothetical protein CHACPFDD_02411 [Phycisphaerae bacterium]|nr:hypothetical protein [Phycisphaerae bacterium]